MELSIEPEPEKLSQEKLEIKPISKLNNKGYVLVKSSIPLKLSKIKKELTVKPFIKDTYGAPPKPFKIYQEGLKKIYLPKFYGINEFGTPLKNITPLGKEIKLTFNGQLRPKQEPVVKNFTDSCGENGSNGGIISVGCGFGKTVLALYLISCLKRKTLVIVHKEFLLNQWKDRINEYLPNAKVGIIQSSKIDIDDKDIVIGMLQSISMKDYDEDIFQDFGFTIIDECHHIGAEVFSRSLPKVNSYYLLGLSATPKRADGLSKVFEWYLGPYLYLEKKKEEREVDVNMIYYDSLDGFYNKLELTFRGKPSIPKMITNISNCRRRNEFIVELIVNIVKNPNRQVLILGDRREQLYLIETLLKQQGMMNVGYYIGGMKEKELKISEKRQVLLATFSMSSEGMDIPSLNTLFMISSKSNIEQSVGRILRKHHGENIPHIYDLVDNFSVFGNQAIKRMNFYKKSKYTIYTSRVMDDLVVPIHKLFEQSSEKEIKDKKVTNKKSKKPIKKGVCLL